jgi:protein ImuB
MRLCYLHLSRFPIQRRVIETPSLSGKPLALVEEVRGARTVAFASTAAMRLGVHPGMTLASATALEPKLSAFAYQPAAEGAALLSLGEALMSISPAFELSPPDGLWLDASAAPLCRGEEGLCRRAIELCAGHGYRAHAAIASQAFTARAVGRYGAPRLSVVAPEESAQALAALPLVALERASSRGAGGGVAALSSLGLTTLGEVAALPVGAVVARLGVEGHLVHKLSRGEDDTPFTPEALPEVLEEGLALDWPAETMEPLLFALKTSVDRLAARLAGRRRAAVRLTFWLTLDSGAQVSVVLSLARPSAQAKLLLDLARHRLEDLTLQGPVAALRVRVDEACDDPGAQLSLGDEPAGDAGLEVVLSRLATTLGEDSLFAAQVDARHRPEAGYSPRAFRPPLRELGLLAGTARGETARPPADEALLERPARLFTMPATLEAEVGESGELLSARLLGKRRKATAVAGPERLCGDWWNESPYRRDYYRVHFEGLGPVWVFKDARDGRFYLQGMFD